MVIKYQINYIFEKQLKITPAVSWSHQLKDKSKHLCVWEEITELTDVFPGRTSGEIFRNKVDLAVTGEGSMCGQ